MNNIESKIRAMNREILDLKTAHPVVSSLRTFYGVFTFREGSRTGTDIYEITYASGTNTIMTWSGWAWNVSQGGLLLGAPLDDKQRFYDIDPYHFENDTFSIFSTRPILSVQYIGNTHGE